MLHYYSPAGTEQSLRHSVSNIHWEVILHTVGTHSYLLPQLPAANCFLLITHFQFLTWCFLEIQNNVKAQGNLQLGTSPYRSFRKSAVYWLLGTWPGHQNEGRHPAPRAHSWIRVSGGQSGSVTWRQKQAGGVINQLLGVGKNRGVKKAPNRRV